MYKRALTKPDGRALWLYSRRPIDPSIVAPMPAGLTDPRAHLRWHPLRGEWVAYATHRQQRTFLPPAAFNPLAPTSDPSSPTELPAGDYDVAVFENRFPTFSRDPGPVPPALTATETAPATGSAEVVVFTQRSDASLGSLPLDHVQLIVAVWKDRFEELGSRPDVQYVMPFENRGVEVGVTLQHPHGQIYAYPFIPPIPARELEHQRAFHDAHQVGLLQTILEAERRDGRRLLLERDGVVAFMPPFARYAYEVWIAPLEPLPSLSALDDAGCRSLARVLKAVLTIFDAMWNGQPFPYVMVFHQAPTDGRRHPEAHLHIEFYPAYRMPGRLKYLAGSELGAGTFTADTLPEEKAAELRAVRDRVLAGNRGI